MGKQIRITFLNGLGALFVLGGVTLVSVPTALADDFKGEPKAHEVTLGASAGLGLVGSTPGFVLMGSAAKKIVNHGFIEDINNQVFGEIGLGIIFHQGGSSAFYSAHVRWDFLKDEDWTLYGLGGFGGNGFANGLGGTIITFFPRFAAGAFYFFTKELAVRFEASHEVTTLGISFSL